jgi:CDP-6-deoxy-D-xylo-4-hexulose-3-dehydrase
VHDKSGDVFDDLFRFVLPGYNVRPLEMSGALGIEQLAKVPDLVRGRRENAAYFQERFADLDTVRIQTEVGESSWFGFSFILEKTLAGRRRDVVAALTAAGIESRPIVACRPPTASTTTVCSSATIMCPCTRESTSSPTRSAH